MSAGTTTWDVWTSLPGMPTGLNTEHTLTFDYSYGSGDYSVIIDGTTVDSGTVSSGLNRNVGFHWSTGTVGEGNPYDYRFKITSPEALP